MACPGTAASVLLGALLLAPPSSAEYRILGHLEGGTADIKNGRFSCPSCNTSKDCGLKAQEGSRHQQQDNDWRIWRTDGGYKIKECQNMRLCIRKWMVGCNGQDGPSLCNSYTEVCSPSEAPFDTDLRSGPYEVCSTAAFMSPASVTLIITIPLVLCVVSLVSIASALMHAFQNGYCQCPPSPSNLPVMLSSAMLIVFSFLTFFSPHFTCGIGGMAIGILAIITHAVASRVGTERGMDADLQKAANQDSAQRWLLAASGLTLVLVYATWGDGYPLPDGVTLDSAARECSEFYSFFNVDPRLLPADHDKSVRHWGYCDKEYVSDTLWNVTAVQWLGLVVSFLHLHTFGGVALQRAIRSSHKNKDPSGAQGPGAFLMTQPNTHAYVNLAEFTITGRHSRRETTAQLESYGDVRGVL
eukprot:Rhum_TRINITY_DN14855_c2_g2::Rhum_TRINITY_DN14855_c2_g2_i2::g.122547::m.122547